MPPEPRPIDWEAPFGTDWFGVQASLVYAPSFTRAQFFVERRPLTMPAALRKTGIWAQLPDTQPQNAYEALFGVYRVLRDCESDYWVRYKRK